MGSLADGSPAGRAEAFAGPFVHPLRSHVSVSFVRCSQWLLPGEHPVHASLPVALWHLRVRHAPSLWAAGCSWPGRRGGGGVVRGSPLPEFPRAGEGGGAHPRLRPLHVLHLWVCVPESLTQAACICLPGACSRPRLSCSICLHVPCPSDHRLSSHLFPTVDFSSFPR